MNGPPDDRCLFCGTPAPVIWVHGHGQCAFCGTNRDPCCDGAPDEPLDGSLPTLITARLVLLPAVASGEAYPPGYGRWTVAEAGALELPVGEVLLAPHGQNSPEIELSFRIDLVARGQGFAREAARVVIEHGEKRLGLTELVAFVHPDHRAPARILSRLGFQAEGRRMLRGGGQVVVWRRRSQA
ncbi:GNAT family N-acetyltransferase [Geminicoccus roseus]|uniref:GNAT family N-acetyltransferase n=1 Tax=Geminicoccus roseus TaxID=404900 RepID=UPI000409159D|nr:GNAT family N-acetyltransferase [Geminicoccus roseus]